MQIPLQRVKKNGMVDFWDCGPQAEPDPPPAPQEPDPKLKGAAAAAAQIEYEDNCVRYKDALRAWTAARKDYREWFDVNGGPVKLERFGVTAREAFERDPKRYKLDLPRGMKPGRAQVLADEAYAAELEELKRAAALDPQFGTQEARA